MARNPKVKKPFQQTEYTKEMIEEIRKCMLDPVYFANNYVYILHPVKGKIKFKLYDYQIEMMRAYQNNRWCISKVCRQAGKTELTATFLIWRALFFSDQTILVAANKLSNAMEIMSRIKGVYEELPDWIKCGIDESQYNKTAIAFENGSKIMAQATSANTGRGYSISTLYVDEMAHIGATSESGPNLALQNAFWASILPILSTGGNLCCTSTPNGDNDLFATLWRGAVAGTNPFKYVEVDWEQVPRDVSKEEFMRDTIALIGERKFRQEYKCEFISSAHTLFDSLVISQAKVSVLPVVAQIGELYNQEFWRIPNTNNTYIVGVDPSQGSGGDYSVIEVYEFPSMVQVAEYRTNEQSPATLYSYLKSLLKFLENHSNQVYYSVENNALGQAIVALYEADVNPLEKAIFMSEEGKDTLGYNSNIKTKGKSLVSFKELFERGQIKINSITLLNEMTTLIRKDNTFKAQTGATDDCVFATLIVIRIIEDMASFDVNAYNKLHSFQNVTIENWDYTPTETESDEDFDYGYMPISSG
mgnify:CR=1 FL=1